MSNTVKEHFLKDYRPPEFIIPEVELDFELDPTHTRVRSRLHMARNGDHQAPLRLHAESMTIESVCLDGAPLPDSAWRFSDEHLVVEQVPDRFTLEVVNVIDPLHNTALEGLYQSGGNFCTQCEAEGFRRITPFLDRPDVMSLYRVRIVADRARYPVLLSNGNLKATGELEDGRHFAVWEDPWPKPCYLFALVAGDLVAREDRFTTAEGRQVSLKIWVERHNLDKTAFAMQALKRAMRWDEVRFGLCYDLDVFNIVAVDDFNMGAMENKSLNIFNAKYILARPETATDADYEGIESVVAHEYFHNWTGNRVTCRDWFQLTLKEGLTVFRDQEYTADQLLPSAKRIQDVIHLRRYQFPEDAGPMSHPIQPQSYIKMDNFYTMTVYEKGAEVVRIYQTLLGREGFRKGMDLYFQRHDGQAVTVEDFRNAMADANGVDLSQMHNWYVQPGTPHVSVVRAHDAETGTLTLTLTQRLPKVGEDFRLLVLPVRFGLLDRQGEALPLRFVEGESATLPGRDERERVLLLTEKTQRWTLENVPPDAVPALLRDFSAPVVLEADYDDEEWAHLAAHDPDDFLRWEALQHLALKTLMANEKHLAEGRAFDWSAAFLAAYEARLARALEDPTWHALALTLPDEVYLGEQYEVIPVARLHAVRKALRRLLAERFESLWAAVYDALSAPDEAYVFNAQAYGRRSLKNLALSELVLTGR